MDGVWRFQAPHPEWTEDEGGEDGWEQTVAWYATATPHGLVLIDPLVEDWESLEALTLDHRGCAGVIRTCHWHQRSIAEVNRRYGAEVWACPAADAAVGPPLDHAVEDQDELFDAIRVLNVERADEVALWLRQPRALVFGDAMLRRPDGELR